MSDVVEECITDQGFSARSRLPAMQRSHMVRFASDFTVRIFLNARVYTLIVDSSEMYVT